MSEVFFTSDLHLGYERVISKSLRPFESEKEMTEAIIRNYNRRVSNEDTVYILGDLFYRDIDSNDRKFIHKCLQRLNGKKILIVGNHDKWCNLQEFKIYFESISTNLTIYHEGVFIHLSHFPLRNKKFEGKHYHLFGHIHNSYEINYRKFRKSNSRNVGVDYYNYFPVTFKELLSYKERARLYDYSPSFAI